MTRKDYILIAGVFNRRINAIADGATDREIFGAVKSTAMHMATALATDNPRFDRERFLAACGVDKGETLLKNYRAATVSLAKIADWERVDRET